MPSPSAQKSVSAGGDMGHSWVGETTKEPGLVLALRGQFSGGVTGTRPTSVLHGPAL